MANQPGSRNEDISEVLFHIELTDLKNFKLFNTKEFFVRGNPWYLEFFKYTEHGKDSLDACLHSNFEHEFNNSTIVAEFEMKILSLIPKAKPYCGSVEPSVFSSKKSNWGSSFITWNRLMDPENGFVMDDKCSLQIKIKSTPLMDDSTYDYIKVETINFCDDCSQRKFRMTINKFHEFFAVSSPEIVFKDFSFHISAYQLLNNLELCMYKYGINDCLVSFTFKFISYDANIKPIKFEVSEEFRANVTDTETYYLATATWKQLTNPAKKFIQNNSFVIEVDSKIETDKPKAKKCPKCCAVFLECPICFENLKLVPISTITTCGHMFCQRCATDTLRKNKKCPSCNAIAPLKSIIRTYLPSV